MGPDQLQDNQPKHSSVPSLLDGSVDDQWKTQVQHLLTELVQVQTKLAKNQEEELKLLNILTTQVSFDFRFICMFQIHKPRFHQCTLLFYILI